MPENAAATDAPDQRAIAPDRPLPRRYYLGRLNLEVRQHAPRWQQALILGGSILLGLLISGVILVCAGVDAGDLVDEFLVQTLFDPQNVRAVLTQAAPLILVGLGASTAFRARFWNLGIEGQMIWGAIAATAVSLFQIGLPAARLPLMALAAALAGMLWSLIPALFKMRWRVNEIISTLLMNYFAVYFLYYLLFGVWKDPSDGFPHSALLAGYERLPEIGGGISSALPFAFAFAAVVWWLVHVSRIGLYINFVFANDRMAYLVGVPIRAVTLAAVLISGALAGLGGFVITSAIEGRLTQGFFEGYGFSGILIAFLARNDPLGATATAVLVAALFITGRNLQIFYQIPFAMVQLIQAIIVICVAGSEFLLRHRIHWLH
jgi:general nucleoside transport system permease protein